MVTRTNDPHGVFIEADRAAVELTKMDAQINAHKAARPSDLNGLLDLRVKSLDLTRRAVNGST